MDNIDHLRDDHRAGADKPQMRDYIVKTRLSDERQKQLYWFCRDYGKMKKDAQSEDERTRNYARRCLVDLDFCFIKIGSQNDLSGGTIRALRENVCDGISYDKMKQKPPCGKNQFYKLRRDFFELLDKRLKGG